MKTFTIGADPEVLLFDPVLKSHVSAIGLIGGTKEAPRPMKNGAVQEDNVMAEFNIPPANSEAELFHHMKAMLDELGELVKTNEMYTGLTISDKCAAHYNANELRHPQAKVAGCDPDFNAWTLSINPPPKVTEGTLRTAGGHIHVGFEVEGERKDEDIYLLVRCMDVTLGLGSILLDPDTERKKLYGKAGCHRPTNYGLEYRVLSNFWIFTEELNKWAYDGVVKAFEFRENCMDLVNQNERIIRRAIDTGDKKLAEAAMRRFGIEV